MHVLIIGCGYVGDRFAQQAFEQGWTVSALTRSTERATAWKARGMTPIVGDVLDPASLAALPEADLCLYAVGYDRTADVDKRDVYVTGLRNVLNQISLRVPRLIYVSSTSVYGQSQGEVVNEASPCDPQSESGSICLQAEQVVRQFYPEDDETRDATILRLSGIYGPGRLIGRREQLMNQAPLPGNPNAWLNLIHVADIIETLFRLAEKRPQSSLYLLSDNSPQPRVEFYSELARQFGTPAPVMSATESDALGKRCDSSKIRRELQLELQFPNTQLGIEAILAAEAGGT